MGEAEGESYPAWGWRVVTIKIITHFMPLFMGKTSHRSPRAQAPWTVSPAPRVFIIFPVLCPLPPTHTHTHTERLCYSKSSVLNRITCISQFPLGPPCSAGIYFCVFTLKIDFSFWSVVQYPWPIASFLSCLSFFFALCKGMEWDRYVEGCLIRLDFF